MASQLEPFHFSKIKHVRNVTCGELWPFHQSSFKQQNSRVPLSLNANGHQSIPLCHFRTSPVLCSASSNPRNDPTRQILSSSPSNWWTPLFGWSSDPDYSQSTSNAANPIKSEPGRDILGQSEREMGRPTRAKFSRGCFTEEKAKEPRKKTMETSTFHDIMYHSAIASRLASDVSGHQERGGLLHN